MQVPGQHQKRILDFLRDSFKHLNMFASCLSRLVVLKHFEVPQPFAIKITEYGMAKANPDFWNLS